MAGFPKGFVALCAVASALAACGGGAPPNDVAAGVGFQDYQQYEARRAALRGEPVVMAAPIVPPVAPVSAALPPVSVARAAVSEPAPAPASAPAPAPVADVTRIAAAAIAEIEATPAPQPSAVATPAPLPANPAISDEQEFAAVAARETIESDAERRARMQAERVTVNPMPLPERPADLGPNIIDYALSTSHAVGAQQHARSPIRQARHDRACAAFRSADLAQEWFLQNGGPGRDRQGLDPDGDGFACGWDPSLYRAAAAAARN